MGIIDFFNNFFGVSKKDNQEKEYISINNLKENIQQFFGSYDEKFVDEIINKITEKYSLEKSEISFSELIEIINQDINNVYYSNYTNRLDIAEDIDEIINNNPELFNAVRLYASYIVFGSSIIKVDEYKVIYVHDNLVIRNETDEDLIIELEKAKSIIEKFEKVSEIKDVVYQLAKDLIKYGDAFLEIIRDESGRIVNVGYLPSNKIIIFTNKYGKVIKIAQILDKNKINLSDVFSGSYINDDRVIVFNREEFLHVGDKTPAGISDNPFLNIAKVWRIIKILEQSLVVYRLGRAKRLIVFFLDVSGKTEEDAKRYIKSFKDKISKIFNISGERGDIFKSSVNLSLGQDIIIPIRKDSKTRVETIQSDTSQKYSEDIIPFYKRLLNNLFVGWALSSEKTGKEEYEKEAFLRLVKIYQSSLANKLTQLYNMILKSHGIDNIKVMIEFPSPDSDTDIKIVDAILRRIMIINQIVATLGVSIPTEWVLKYSLKDLSSIELDELIELINKQSSENIESENILNMFESIIINENEESKNDKEIYENKEKMYGLEQIDKTNQILKLYMDYINIKKR